jgi:dipeptidyl aminopeptidase/acylaminoacyl peptidase
MRSGAQRTGYLLQPAGAAFPPSNTRVIAWQQGGPGGSVTNEWGSNVEQPFNLLPNFGMAVLVLPLPGREGFGPKFYNDLANGRNFGQIDIDEAAHAVEYMIGQGYTTRDRVGITGGSYGGYFASQSIVRRPELYAAAVALSSMLDLAHTWEFIARPEVSYWEGRVPERDPAEYAADSPSAHASRIRSPLLLIHGAKDEVPLSIVASFRDTVAATGTPVELISFKEEGHGLSSPSSHMAAAQAQIRWFQRYLADAGGR